MKQLVIGLGEVGTAIRAILECDGYDISMPLTELRPADVLHICFPYVPGRFGETIKRYIEHTGASLVIVHSTVPVGTCDALKVVHSPVRGIHPHLEKGIRTFTKFFGGARAPEAAKLFRARGIKTICSDIAAETEALKLWDTTIYGWNILLQKSIAAYCKKHKIDAGVVYKLANATYNEGYSLLGHPEYTKYVLKDFPGPIGGHCVRENWELLDDEIAIISKDLHKRLTGS